MHHPSLLLVVKVRPTSYMSKRDYCSAADTVRYETCKMQIDVCAINAMQN